MLALFFFCKTGHPTLNHTATICLNASDVDEPNHAFDQHSKSRDLPAKCALCSKVHPANYRRCTVHKDLQRFRKKQQPNTTSRVTLVNSDSPQAQPNSQLSLATSHLNNALTRTVIEPSDTQHLSFSQAVKGNKSKKLNLSHINDPPSDKPLTSQLTT